MRHGSAKCSTQEPVSKLKMERSHGAREHFMPFFGGCWRLAAVMPDESEPLNVFKGDVHNLDNMPIQTNFFHTAGTRHDKSSG